MIIRSITFALNLLNLFLFFHFLLGCEFRKTRGSIIMGSLLAVVLYVLFMPWLDDFLTPYPDFTIVLFALLPVACMKGRKVNLFFLGMALFYGTAPLDDLICGVMMVILKSKTNFDDFAWYIIISQITTAAIFLALIYGTRKFRSVVNEVANRIHPLMIVFYAIAIQISRWEWTYLGPNMNLDEQILYQGINKINHAIVAMIVTGLMVALVLISYQRKRLNREILLKERCIEEQTQQYEFMGRANQESRKFRHDFNRHMDMLADLFDHGRTAELGKYIHQLSDAKERAYYISTGNMVCDAIVNQYYVKCRDAGIMLKCSGAFPNDFSMELTDLCVILSNALENAYEAVSQCAGDREIHCGIGNRKNLILITILNPAAKPLLIENGAIRTTKEDAENHGFGTKNMQEAALRNGGSVRWRYHAGEHVVETKICLKSRTKM